MAVPLTEVTIDGVQREVEAYSTLTEASGAEAVRNAITTLCKREQRVIFLTEEARRAADVQTIADGEKVLERVVESIARLIDVASKIAATAPVATQTPTPAAAAESSFDSTPSLVPPNDGDTAPSPTIAPRGTPGMIGHGAVPAHVIRPAAAAPAVVAPAAAAAAATAAMQQGGRRSATEVIDGPPEIAPEEVQYDPIRDLIGEGAFGKVYRANCRGKLVAVKVPTKQDLTEHQQRMFRHEVTIMRRVFHPNIVLCLGACSRPGKLMIITELMKGDVEKLIHSSRQKLSLRQKLRVAYDAALGLNWLHGICQIVHRDLKPANLLLDENNRVHVTDFGFSEILRGGRGRDLRGPKGTALYMAPEVMRLEEFDQSADVHSYGLILYELATGREPFENYTEVDPFVQALCYNNERPSVHASADIPQGLVDLMTRCWDPLPARRPAFPAIIDTLVQLIVDTAMPEDSPARTFWKRHFIKPSLQEHVPWADLEEIVARNSGTPPAQVGKLENLIGVALSDYEPQRVVTMERFQQFFGWFGKWFEPSGRTLLLEMIDMVEAGWFHSDISFEESLARLRYRQPGTFLVRLSFRDPKTPFTISSSNGTQVEHRRVYRLSYDPRKQERFAVQLVDKGPFYKFPSLRALIETLQRESVISDACPKNVIKVAY